MKRRNVQLAFVGEDTDFGDVQSLTEGDEAVDIDVTGGKIQVIVPAGTPDDRLFERPSLVGGMIRLENGLVLSFEIKDGAEGAQFSSTEQGARDDENTGLSSIPNVPGGA